MKRGERLELEAHAARMSVLGLRLFEARGSLNAVRRVASEAGDDDLVVWLEEVRDRLALERDQAGERRRRAWLKLHPPKDTAAAAALEGFDG